MCSHSLVILDLLSHQGTPSLSLFDLVRTVLQEGIIAPSNLFVFADLSALAVGMDTPALPPGATLTEQVCGRLGKAASYKRRTSVGLPYLPHLFGAPPSTLTALLTHAFEPPTSSQCMVDPPPTSLQHLQVQLEDFIGNVVAPRVQGHRVSLVLCSHGGVTKVTNATDFYRLGDYAVQGVVGESDKAKWVSEDLPLPFFSHSIILPLAKAVGSKGHLLWLHSTCYAPPILRGIAEAMYKKQEGVGGSGPPPPTPLLPLLAFSGAGSPEHLFSSSSPLPLLSTSTTGGAAVDDAPPRVVLASDMPLFSPLQDFVSTWGSFNQSHHFFLPLMHLKAAMASPSPEKGVSTFPGDLLRHLATFDTCSAAELVHSERIRGAWVGEVWWEGSSGSSGGGVVGKPPFTLPPPPSTHPRRRVWGHRDLVAYSSVVWDGEEKAAEKEGPPAVLLELYDATSATAAAHTTARLPQEGSSPQTALALSLKVAGDELAGAWVRSLKTMLPSGGGFEGATPPPPSPAVSRVLEVAMGLWKGTSVAYKEGPWHTSTFCLSTGLRCLDKAIEGVLQGGGGRGGSGSGGGETAVATVATAPPPPLSPPFYQGREVSLSPWEMTTPHAHLFAASLLPLLHAIPSDALLVARNKCLNDGALRLAAARVLSSSASASGAGGAGVQASSSAAPTQNDDGGAQWGESGAATTPHNNPPPPPPPPSPPSPSLLHSWDPPGLLPDLPSKTRRSSDTPRAYLAEVMRAYVEVSASRWPGALRLLGQVCLGLSTTTTTTTTTTAATTSPPPLSGGRGVALAENLSTLLDKVSSGEMRGALNVHHILQTLTRTPTTLGTFEGGMSSELIMGLTHVKEKNGAGGGEGRPLLEDHTLSALRKAVRVGGVYAMGISADEYL